MFSKDNLPHEPLPLPDRFDYADAEMLARVTGFFDLMSRRHSVRQFSPRPVARAVIEAAVATAGRAPSGANHQPWFFAAISDTALKARIRAAAEAEERRFYDGAASDEWLRALEPLGTDAAKPHLEDAPWLIVIFAQRWGHFADGERFKNYYVPESVGIATGFLIAALHQAGLASLTHTPNPMRFLNATLGRPASEKPVMILAVGHPGAEATVPAAAKLKKPLDEILAIHDGTGTD